MNSPPDPESTVIDLLRHGEPAGGDRYRGTVDDPLSERGWAQMRAAVGDHAPWSGVITSPLRRCAEFAHEVGGRLDIPVTIETRLREMSFGLWEGRSASDILAHEGDHLRRFWADPLHNPPPEGEHLADFLARVSEAWETTLAAPGPRHLLMVAHGGVIRMIFAHVLKMPLEHVSRVEVPFACLTRIRADRVGETPLPRLVFHAAPLPDS